MNKQYLRPCRIAALLCAAALTAAMLSSAEPSDTAERQPSGQTGSAGSLSSEVTELTSGERFRRDFYTSDSRLIPPEGMTAGVGTDIPEGMERVAASGGLELYFSEETTEFAVRDTASGKVWLSAPSDRSLDLVAVGDAQKRLSALLWLDFYNAKGALQTFDSYNQSVAFGSFTTERLPDGVGIHYRIGKPKTVTSADVPNIIFADRLEGFLARMTPSQADDTSSRYRKYSLSSARTEEARQKILNQYPTAAQGDIYVLRNPEDPLLSMIADNLRAAGYTDEDLAQDHAAHGIEAVSEPAEMFEVTLHLRLQNGRLSAEIPGDSIRSPEGSPLYRLHVLPCFGAANLSSRGYMLVPDGAGGLVYLNSFSSTNEALQLPVYGADEVLRRTEAGARTEAVCLPVFGMKNEDAGFAVSIDAGEAAATVNCTIPGLQNSYNCVWASFLLNPRDSFSSVGNGVVTTMYPSQLWAGDLAVSFDFLGAEEADVAGMARSCRRWLQERGLLTSTRLTDTHQTFLLETVGMADRDASFLGLIPYKKKLTLTTFEETETILRTLREQGVESIALQLSGWMKGGLRHTSDSRKPESGLGGTKGLSSLLETAHAEQISVFGSMGIQEVSSPSLFYPKKSRLVRRLGDVYAHRARFDYASGLALGNEDTPYLLTPSLLPDEAAAAAEALMQLGFDGVAVPDLGQSLYSDYHESHFVRRDESQQYTRQALEALSAGGGALVDTGYAYALSSAAMLTNLPLGGSGYSRVNEEVPFYPMVIHGYLRYAGTELNHSDDAQSYALRCVAYGAMVHYTWSYRDSSQIKFSNYSDYYALCWQDTLEQAVTLYRHIDDTTAHLASQEITGYRSLNDQVTVTEYADGTAVYVNAGRNPVSVDGIAVPAMDFVVTEGGTAR